MNKSLLIFIVLVIVVIIVILFFVSNDSQYGLRGEEESEGEGELGEVGEPGLYPASEDLGGFCGESTKGSCNTDEDCVSAGCSGQICQSIDEESLITTCEFLECYNQEFYGVSCGCVNNKCQWTR